MNKNSHLIGVLHVDKKRKSKLRNILIILHFYPHKLTQSPVICAFH
jgi:hypothetical protein